MSFLEREVASPRVIEHRLVCIYGEAVFEMEALRAPGALHPAKNAALRNIYRDGPTCRGRYPVRFVYVPELQDRVRAKTKVPLRVGRQGY